MTNIARGNKSQSNIAEKNCNLLQNRKNYDKLDRKTSTTREHGNTVMNDIVY